MFYIIIYSRLIKFFQTMNNDLKNQIDAKLIVMYVQFNILTLSKQHTVNLSAFRFNV